MTLDELGKQVSAQNRYCAIHHPVYLMMELVSALIRIVFVMVGFYELFAGNSNWPWFFTIPIVATGLLMVYEYFLCVPWEKEWMDKNI